MENWGLITYREQYLLVDPTKTSSSQRQSITSIIAHECAHFWFGNLVTMVSFLFLNKFNFSFFRNGGPICG